ncbi:hypothetical protein, partial [Streptosporangium sp. OZ121]|uniref:hypothetical protein n=1 Tax=Streptosporangium sp. OZ121 TaxID=3444183 RepID=UPI003F796652
MDIKGMAFSQGLELLTRLAADGALDDRTRVLAHAALLHLGRDQEGMAFMESVAGSTAPADVRIDAAGALLFYGDGHVGRGVATGLEIVECAADESCTSRAARLLFRWGSAQQQAVAVNRLAGSLRGGGNLAYVLLHSGLPPAAAMASRELTSVMRDPSVSPYDRVRAAVAMAERSGDEAHQQACVRTLFEIGERLDAEPFDRVCAIEALLDLGSVEVTRLGHMLRRCLRDAADPQWCDSLTAVWSTEILTSRARPEWRRSGVAGAAGILYNEDLHPQVRIRAARVLARWGTTGRRRSAHAVLTAIAEDVEETDSFDRVCAAQSRLILARGEARAAETLLVMASDVAFPAEERITAAETLLEYGAPSAKKPALRILNTLAQEAVRGAGG